MMKNKKSLSASDDVDDINISPLIDMVFILLIFFIVTTVFVQEPGVEVDKPYGYNTQDKPKNVIMIAVTSQNTIHYGGEQMRLGDLRDKVQALHKENETHPVIIQADRNANMKTVADVVDQCKLAQVPPGLINLSIERSN